jgi:hypothetical protein
MRGIVIGLLVTILLSNTSCKQENSYTNSCSWTFEGITYNDASCYWGNSTNIYADTMGGLSAQTVVNATNPSALNLGFYDYKLPTTNCILTVVNRNPPLATGQVFINLQTYIQNNYVPTGGNGNQTVNLTVSGGKVTVLSNGPIEMINTNNRVNQYLMR